MTTKQTLTTTNQNEMLQAVLAAVRMTTPEPRLPVRHGELGGCLACKHSIASHFDENGGWAGCTAAKDGTVFILVPATVAATQERRHVSTAPNGHERAHEAAAVTEDDAQPHRGFRRARYTSKLHHKAKPEKLQLSPTRERVLSTVHAYGKQGLTAKDIMRRAKLPHGSVQQTLNWLRGHDLVAAQEDATT